MTGFRCGEANAIANATNARAGTPASANLGLQSVTLVCGEAFIAAVSGPEAIGGYDSEVICSARTQVR